MIAWRITKSRHAPFDATGARLFGARWNSPGRGIIYGSDSFAGAILEILAHAGRPRTLPGPHHAVRIEIPDDAIERVEPASLPNWEKRDSDVARDFGDAWHRQGRSLALLVPSLTGRPIGRNLLIHADHALLESIRVSEPITVPWDERLF